LPVGIADAPAVSYGGKIYVFGGYGKNHNDVKRQVFEYSPTSDTWCLRSPMSTPRWGAAAALYGDHVYVFSGRLVSRLLWKPVTKSVERYDITGDTWTTLNPLPHGLRSQGLMAVTVGSKIYVFNEGFTFEYDPVKDRYARRANAPVARRWATCAHVKAAMEDRIHIVGGWDSVVSDATDVNYYYLPTSDKWIGPRAPAPYRAYGVTRDNPVWENRIYFGFGHRSPDLFYSDIYVYSPEKDSWAGPLGEAHFERDGVACAVVDGMIYVIGGRSEPNDAVAFGLTCNERFDLAAHMFSKLQYDMC
jgi:hypothetical protein